jgi:NTE family protein
VRIGVVLGAGGSVGIAYHAAVLGAIEGATGWDPRSAAVIVGTSAGSITGSMLRAGMSAGDLMRTSEGLPLSADGARVAQMGRPRRPRPQVRDLLQVRPVADLRGVIDGVVHPRDHSLGALLAALVPSGGIPTDAISAGIDAVYAGKWPAHPLWLCAVALRRGQRVVFGRPGSPVVGVGQAVGASCAIPGYFQPVTIGGRRYVDGGVWSMTNMDLLARPDLRLDLVIVSAPMSHASARPAVAADTFLRQSLRARLGREAAAVRRAGIPVITIAPDRQVSKAMGLNWLDARSRGAVSRTTHASVSAWLATRAEGRWLGGILAGARTTVPASPTGLLLST